VPELPEVEALTRALDERACGLEVTRCEVASFAALKTFDPPLESVVGRKLAGCRRKGKYLLFDFGEIWLVVHLARGGWVKWHEQVPATRPKPGRSPLALRLALSDGSGMDVTEMGTEKRLAVWVVRDPGDVEGVATLGPDVMDESLDAGQFSRLIGSSSGTVKNALTRQSVVAGVGNAYSDEALHLARISPFKPASKLGASEAGRLLDAVRQVMSEAVERSVGLSVSELKGDKKRAMRVHGRTGEPCPECGDVVREVSYATKSLQYCPTCQTGGKVLADRRLSRLVK
jgi:formamidopyrimidine-DNA glycosylase